MPLSALTYATRCRAVEESPRSTCLKYSLYGKNLAMGWVATPVVLGTLALGACFMLLQQKAMWAELKIARQERAAHPDPNRRRNSLRGLIIVFAIYGTVGAAFYVGWHAGGTTAGVLSAVGLALAWVLGGAALAVKSAWVSRE